MLVELSREAVVVAARELLRAVMRAISGSALSPPEFRDAKVSLLSSDSLLARSKTSSQLLKQLTVGRAASCNTASDIKMKLAFLSFNALPVSEVRHCKGVSPRFNAKDTPEA